MLLYSRWLSLGLPVRAEIAHAFGIAKTGPTHVQDNRIVSDGYKIEDVENALSTESMQDFLGSKEKDHDTLFDLVVEKITAPEPAPPIEAPKIEEKPEPKVEVIKRPKKK